MKPLSSPPIREKTRLKAASAPLAHPLDLGEGRRIRSTTVICVRRGDSVVMAADGQVSLGATVMKGSAKKIRRLYQDKVLAGFAGSTADAFSLFARFETDVEDEPVFRDAENKFVRPARRACGREAVAFEQVVDGDFALLFHLARAADDALLVKLDGRDAEARVVLILCLAVQPRRDGAGMRVEPLGFGERDGVRPDLRDGFGRARKQRRALDEIEH